VFVLEIETKKKVNVAVRKIAKKELKNLANFDFNWIKEKDYELYKLVIYKSNEILGLLSIERIFSELRIEIRLLEISKENVGSKKKYDRIAGILIAFACKESFQNGFYGFVSLIPKTKLINHYQQKYGFIPFGKHLAVELKSSELLMNKYLLDE